MALERPRILPDVPPLSMVSASDPKWKQQSHPGYGLTARRLVSAYRQAELGYPQWQCDLFDDVVESDGHLRSQLASRLSAVAGKPWLIQAGGDAKADIMAAQILQQGLREVPNFHQTIIHQLKRPWFGWAASEIGWRYTDGVYMPSYFENVPQRRFTFDEDDEPLLTVDDPSEGIPLAPGKWWYSQSWDHHIAARAGLLRTASWWALFKRLSVRDWIVFAERFGLPYVTGEYAEGTHDIEKAVLKQAVQMLGRDGAAVFSNTCKISVHTVHDGGKSSDVHGAIVTMCNAEMSKLIAGATLTSGEGSSGSYGLGDIHAAQAFDLRLADAEALALQFEADVGAPFVKFNKSFGGVAARPPRLKINVVRDLNPMTRAQIANLLANGIGLEIDEEQIRQEFNFKSPNGTPLKGQGKPPGSPTPGVV